MRRLSLRTAVNCLYLDVSNNDVRTLEEINGGVNLVYLDASSNDIGQGGRLGLPIPGAPRSAPLHSPGLEAHGARWGPAAGSVVLACLEGLNLANNDIGPHIPAGAFDWCPNVRAVSLNDNDIISFPDDPCWPQLQVLNLANNDLRVVPTLPRCPYVRQIYLDKNELGDDQIPYICRLIDLHPYLIKLKLGHNNFSDAGIAQICEYARAKNPYLFHSSQPTLQATFSQPQSLYGANSQGERNSNPGVVQACWVVEPEPSNGPAFAEAFVVAEVTPVTGLVRPPAALCIRALSQLTVARVRTGGTGGRRGGDCRLRHTRGRRGGPERRARGWPENECIAALPAQQHGPFGADLYKTRSCIHIRHSRAHPIQFAAAAARIVVPHALLHHVDDVLHLRVGGLGEHDHHVAQRRGGLLARQHPPEDPDARAALALPVLRVRVELLQHICVRAHAQSEY